MKPTPYTRTRRQRIKKATEVFGRRVQNFVAYLGCGHSVRTSWEKAGKTL
jgi:hypothetical protein